MSQYPTTGSILNSRIHTGLSTQIIVKVGTETVGAIQRLQVNQSRTLDRIKEVGLDGILEIVPKQPTEFDATISRIVFDRLRLPEAFARGFINIKSQLVPFDILIIDRTNGDGEGAVKHQLTSCWFNRYSPTYQADNFIITEEATIWVEDISTTLGNSQASAVGGGERGINYEVNERERLTDAGAGGGDDGGGFRGTMDVANIINAAFEK
jgi:hypothetical protein